MTDTSYDTYDDDSSRPLLHHVDLPDTHSFTRRRSAEQVSHQKLSPRRFHIALPALVYG